MKKCLGIIDFENDNVVIEGLSDYRTIPAMSFLGRYRIIDFVLSNMVNSGIDQIEVLVKEKPRSLIDHIGSSEQYDINPKHGAIQILYSDRHVVNKAYLTDVGLLRQYITTISETDCDYVAIAPSYMIDRINYQDVIDAHIESKADVTVVYKHVDENDKHFDNCRDLELSPDNRIADSHHYLGVSKKTVSLETYVLSKEKLIEIINKAYGLSKLCSFIDYLTYAKDELNIHGYEYHGYVRCIDSLKAFYDTNMELINYEKAGELFHPDWPIYTKTNDSVPAFYSPSAKVKNCLIANGCVVEGELENCILGRGVKVKKGVVAKNSLLLPDCVIEEGKYVENAVIDKHAVVKHVDKVVGSAEIPMYVARRDVV